LARGDLDQSESEFRKSINIESNKFDPYLGLALVSYTKGKKAEAKNYLEKAKNFESRLNHGMAGIFELENMGYFKPSNIKGTLEKLLKEAN
jgi:tetratricopeptide (TPR) repeat protein